MADAKQDQGCRRAARLLSERSERELAFGERVGLRLHLWHCTACVRYSRQLELLAGATARWRQPPNDRDGD